MLQAEAVADADAVVLAVPDRLIGKITTDLVPQLRSGAMLIGLDPAAAYAGVMPTRDDLTYFVVHPCYPMLLSVFLPNFFGKRMVMRGEVGAMSIIAVLPLFVLSIIVQRYLVRGLTMGAVK